MRFCIGRGLVWGAVCVCVVGGMGVHAAEVSALGSDSLGAASGSELRGLIERFTVDRGAVTRSQGIPMSVSSRARIAEFYSGWRARLGALDFAGLSQGGKVDYLLFENLLGYALRRLEIEAREDEEIGDIVPFAGRVVALQESRGRMEGVDPKTAATTLEELRLAIEGVQEKIEKALGAEDESEEMPAVAPFAQSVANRALGRIGELRKTLEDWYEYYHGYDPLFTWWVAAPYEKLDEAFEAYGDFVREKLVGIEDDDKTTIIGDPIGSEALQLELAHDMIPYTAEELVAIAEEEFAWCDAEMLRASRDLGYGDDWHAALEYVKTKHVAAGEQADLIRDLALESIAFVEEHDLVTVPELAKEIWRIEMMSPERQLVNPFFTGGEVISVSFPTNTMTHEQKLMSMRGNNVHFSRATVHHEIVPGHHLQLFMADRYHNYRKVFRTPFGVEGWALYWEMLLWDLDFQQSPEDRIGMLFWRMHRCARIIFSLSFHLGEMTPQECIDFLVERVGHERENATAEVRRSFAGNYSPLYQCAYMLGGLQLRALHGEFVDSGAMTDREFHDAILRMNSIPIEMVRATLREQALTRDFSTTWKFYGEVSVGE